jgi:hypothetical protein
MCQCCVLCAGRDGEGRKAIYIYIYKWSAWSGGAVLVFESCGTRGGAHAAVVGAHVAD